MYSYPISFSQLQASRGSFDQKTCNVSSLTKELPKILPKKVRTFPPCVLRYSVAIQTVSAAILTVADGTRAKIRAFLEGNYRGKETPRGKGK